MSKEEKNLFFVLFLLLRTRKIEMCVMYVVCANGGVLSSKVFFSNNKVKKKTKNMKFFHGIQFPAGKNGHE